MLKKIIFLIFFSFSLVSGADDDPVSETDVNPGISECHGEFAHTDAAFVDSSPHGENIMPLKTRAIKDYWYEHLKRTMTQASFKEKLQSKQQFNARWKKDLLESLSILDPAQILGTRDTQISGLVERIVDFTKNNDSILLSEQKFLQSLVEGITEIIPQFSRVNLMDILYFLQDQGTDLNYDQFVRAWRKRAITLQREFASLERVQARMYLKRMGIPPLNKPHDLDSGNVETGHMDFTNKAASSQ